MTTQTFSFLAPNGGAEIAAPDGTLFTADAFGLINNVGVAYCRTLENAGCRNLGVGPLTDGAAWNSNNAAPQTLAAAGATQGNAAKITQNNVVISATASTEGAILEAVATGAVTEGIVLGRAIKLYPPVGGKFDQVTSTNESKLITANKSFRVRQRNATAYALELTA